MTAPDQEPIDLVDALNTGRISRRDFMRSGMLLGLSIPALAAVLAACGDDDDDNAESTAGGADTGRRETPATDGSRQARQRRRRAAAGRFASPSRSRRPRSTRSRCRISGRTALIAQSFEFLATLGDEGAIAPGLAESWESNADGTVWTFKLRQGVKWHDGTDFTSADVAATLDRLVGRRQRRAQGRHRRGLGRQLRSDNRGRHAARRRTATSRTSCRSSMPSR